MKKLIGESLEEYLKESSGEGIDPIELKEIVEDIIATGKSASEIFNRIKALGSTYPEIHSELGEVEGHDKYVVSLQPYFDWWNSLSDEEMDEIENSLKSDRDQEESNRKAKKVDEFNTWMESMVEKGVFARPLSYEEYHESFSGAPRSAIPGR